MTAVVAVSAVVALAAGDVRLLLPPALPEGVWSWVVRIAGAAAAAGGVAWLLRQRKRLPRRGDHDPDPTVETMVAAAAIMGLLALTSLLGPRPPVSDQSVPQDPVAVEPAPEDGARAGGAARQRTSSGLPGGGWGLNRRGGQARRVGGATGLPAGADDPQDDRLLGNRSTLLLLALLAAAAGIGLLILGRRLRNAPQLLAPEPDAVATGAEPAVAWTGAAFYAGDDPRKQITAAYHRLLLTLAAAGAPRQPQEAPYEHLGRALGALRVEAAPLHRLTDLYVLAQFSRRAITSRHSAAAGMALGEALRSLQPFTPAVAGAGRPAEQADRP